jgi:hypothetical protein
MRVIFHKTSHAHYTLECIRADGSATKSEPLEAKSYLRHDLIHFAYESSFGLRDSFYGTIARGKNLNELTPRAMQGAEPMSEEARVTEMITGFLTGAL